MCIPFVVVIIYYAYASARMCVLLLLYIIVVYYGVRTVPIVVLCACARGALRILYADGKGIVAGHSIQSDRECDNPSCHRRQHTVCTLIILVNRWGLKGANIEYPQLQLTLCHTSPSI